MTYEEFICVLVPSRGFHYINEEREVMVGTLKFSSPRGDFIILTSQKIGRIKKRKFSSPRGDFIILTVHS